MRVNDRTIPLALVTALTAACVLGSPASLQAAAPKHGPHGGSLRQTASVQIETSVDHRGVRLHLYDLEGQPISVARGRGIASLRVEGHSKRYRYDLLPSAKQTLTAPVDLSKLAGRQIELDIQLIGIAEARGRISFKEVATIQRKITKHTGQNGSSVPAGTVQVRAGVFKVSAADATFIAAQKRCPVMDEPLDAMGGPYKVDAAGKAIYICCPGCAKKIAADPHKYLAILKQQGVEAPVIQSSSDHSFVPVGTEEVRAGVFKVTAADAPFIEAQKRCPVMDEPLDAMGGPYKVNAAGKAIYICCPGCAKKIAAEPDKYIGVLAREGISAPLLR